MNKNSNVILSLYPNAKGLGYVCADMPHKLIDYGMITIRPFGSRRVLDRIEKFLDFFQPKLLVVRNCKSESDSRRKARKVTEKIVALAKEKKLPVYEYTREQIRFVFEQFSATSKYEIAMKIIEWFPELKDRSPKIRKVWMDEDYNMGIFDAFSLINTHQYLDE